jgi:division protein CdvB (Snf7/Vps24/ESCRT-III family)
MVRKNVASPQLDRIIAQSKQVTVDLMTVRRDVARQISSYATHNASIEAARSRLSLVIDQMHAMSQELHEMWMESSPYKDTDPPLAHRVRRALPSGQLTLTGGRE